MKTYRGRRAPDGTMVVERPGPAAGRPTAGRARHTVDSTRLDLLQLGRFLGRQPLADVSSDDLRGFFAWLGRQHGRRALVALLLDCGLKRDEAVALRRADLELEVSPPRLHVRHRATSQRARRRTLPLGDRLAATLRALPGGEADGAVLGLSARGVDFVVETCARRAGVRPGTKVTPQMLRDTYACRRVAARLELEAALADPAARAALERDHDRLLLRELGLADSSGAAGRYRRMV
jgi:integrase